MQISRKNNAASRRSIRRRVAAMLGIAALAAGILGAGVAQGNLDKSGNVVVAFHGGILPVKLPRAKMSPVSVQIGGRVKTTDRSEPPKLKKIVLQINRHGKLSTKGLKRCRISQLLVRAAGEGIPCKSAQVGHGNVTTRVTLPGQGTFASNGKLYAFNGRVRGRPGILAQVHSDRPLNLTYVMQFQIRKGKKGTFGTTLVARMPSIASGHGRISAFDMTLGRRYRLRGKRTSFMSANCPAPKGFPSVTFPFARATYNFDDGKKLTSVLSKQCRVRR